jgi:hypothetical protein
VLVFEDVLEVVFWSFAVVVVGVAVAFAVVLPSGDVVVAGVSVGLLLPCARAAVENRDNAANVERRSDRFSDNFDCPIAIVFRFQRGTLYSVGFCPSVDEHKGNLI